MHPVFMSNQPEPNLMTLNEEQQKSCSGYEKFPKTRFHMGDASLYSLLVIKARSYPPIENDSIKTALQPCPCTRLS